MPPKIGVHPRDDAFIHAMPAYLSRRRRGRAQVGRGLSGQPGRSACPTSTAVRALGRRHRPPARGHGRHLDHRGAHRRGEHARHPRARGGPVESIGILGCGRQGTCTSSSPRQVFPTLRRALLFDRHPERAEALAAAHPRLDVEVASAAEEIAAGADVVVHDRRDRPRPRAADPARAPGGRDRGLRGRLRRHPVRGPIRGRGLSSSSTTSPSTATTASRATSPATPTTRSSSATRSTRGDAPAGPARLRAARHRPGGRGRGRGDQPPRGRRRHRPELPL